MEAFKKFYDYYTPGKLLRDLYEHKKQFDKNFTYAFIAKKAGIKSTGNLTEILQGKAAVSSRLIVPLANVFELKKHEVKYFSALVFFSLAKTHEEKSHYFDTILELRRSKINDLSLENYEYFSKWYYIAIRELLEFYRFNGDFNRLAKKLHPRITPSQAKKAIKILEKTGLIKKGPDGNYEQAEAIVTSGEWKSMAVASFQRESLDLAKSSMNTVAKDKRSISTVTISISDGTILKIKDVIKRCRAEILELADKDENSDAVYNATFSVFPMSDVNGGGKDA